MIAKKESKRERDERIVHEYRQISEREVLATKNAKMKLIAKNFGVSVATVRYTLHGEGLV